ncbi:MAG: DPP IV N-terminal domain-containing protein [Chloroflexota bacterium]
MDKKKAISSIALCVLLIAGCTHVPTDIPNVTPIATVNPPSMPITVENRGTLGNMVWSPDGEEIAYTLIHPFNVDAVYILDIDTSEVRLLIEESILLSWSPDGSILIYHYWDGIGIVDSNTGGTPDIISDGFVGAFSPDGTRVAVMQQESSGSGDTYQVTISLIDLEIRSETVIFDSENVIRLDSLHWSPDNKYLAFSIKHDDFSNPTLLMLLDIDTNEVVQFTSDRYNSGSPSWSPNGSQIAYTYSQELFDDFLVFANVDGECRIEIHEEALGDGMLGGIAWSPDGRYLAYEMENAIYLLDLFPILGGDYLERGTICP